MSGAFVYQLRDARNDSAIQKVAGVCSTGDQYRDYINEATRQLMNRGGWVGNELLMRLCSSGCDIVFPRYVGTVLGLRPGCGDYIDIRNHWWAILAPNYGNGYGNGWGDGVYGGWGTGAYGYGYNASGYTGYRADAIDTNNVPTFNQVSGNTGKFIRYHVVKAQDYGKTITLFGKQYGGQPLQTEVSGAWVNGVTITAATPLAQTTVLVTKITSVVREATEGMAYLYEYDPATTKLRMLAIYEPSETNPSYRHMRVPNTGSCCRNDENGESRWQVEALVKLQFVPVIADEDFLLISNFDALAMMIQSIKAREANDIQLSRTMFAAAIEELNYEMRNKSPSDQTSVRVNVMGSNYILTSPV